MIRGSNTGASYPLNSFSGNKLPKYAQKSKKFITEKLMEKVPEEILHEQISEELFERDYTIYD